MNQCFNLLSPHRTITINRDCKGISIDVNLNDIVPKGTTSERPIDADEGDLYYNITLHYFEFWNGTEWIPMNGSAPVTTSKVYYGLKDDGELLTKSQIETSSSIDYIAGEDITIPFNNQSGGPKREWMAYLISETGITNYFINQFDYGILAPENTFDLPTTIDIYNFIQSTNLTQTNDVIFKH